MVKANCLIDIPVEVERVNPGDLVTVQLLSGSTVDGTCGQRRLSSNGPSSLLLLNRERTLLHGRPYPMFCRTIEQRQDDVD